MQNRLLRFLLNDELEHPDNYTPASIIEWNNDHLEFTHNWVQWCFPLQEGSLHQPDSPVLGQREIQMIRTSSVAQANLDALLWRVVDFYDQTTHWLRPHDHNHLRITRIIKSLTLLAPPEKGLMFYHFIMWRVSAYSKPCIINPTTVHIWKQAADLIRYPASKTARDVVNAIRETEKVALAPEADGTNPDGTVVEFKTFRADEVRAKQAAKQEGSL